MIYFTTNYEPGGSFTAFIIGGTNSPIDFYNDNKTIRDRFGLIKNNAKENGIDVVIYETGALAISIPDNDLYGNIKALDNLVNKINNKPIYLKSHETYRP